MPCPTQGQFSFAPATKTTVVTTTTTTTTTFPPFVIKAPRNLRHRDPEQYPLASTPTPRALKRLKLDLGDQVAYFEEADEDDDRLTRYQQTQKQLADSNGVVTTRDAPRRSRQVDNPFASISRNAASLHADSDLDEPVRNRSATPISMSDAAELSSFHRRNSRPKITPRRTKTTRARANVIDSETESSSDESPLNDARPLDLGISNVPQLNPSCSEPEKDSTDSLRSSFTQSDREQIPRTTPLPSEASRRNNLNLDTSPSLDQSLPSPSLSPITSNTALHRPQPLSRAVHQIFGSSHQINSNNDGKAISGSRRSADEPQQSKSPPAEEELQAPQPDGVSMDQIPLMMDIFDNLPDNLKSYAMYNLLRRSSKPTLRFVKETIDPVLCCDFIRRLPVELSLQVLSFLSAPEMCSAAQVSRHWRHLVDTHEGAWRGLIVSDGFKLTDAEVGKACAEGWGWGTNPYKTSTQYHMRHAKMQGSVHSKSGRSPPLTDERQEDFEPAVPESSRRKRKNLGKPRSAKKLKHVLKQDNAGSTSTVRRLPPLARTKGHSAYVDYARAFTPCSIDGLPQLSQLHLFKSIYQRHAMMRSNWMNPKSQPLHLAFKAHNRHVVTCLQFDENCIITGSDDAHIDIYETRTGRTIKKLQGHEGGVWALEYLDKMLVSGSTDRSVRIWDMQSGRNLHVFQGHTSTVRCLQILQPTKVDEHADGTPIMMPKQPLIITGSRDSTCRVWKLPEPGDQPVMQTGPPANDNDNPYFQRTLTGHNHSVRAISAHADTLVSGSYDTFVRVWKISTGECVFRLVGHTSKVYSVVLDYDRKRCISGSMDNMVKVWSIESGTCLFNLDGHTSLVGLLDLRDDFLVSAAADATLRVWNPANGQCRNVLVSHENAITCFLHDGQKIISGSEKVLKMWNTKTGECVKDLLTKLDGVWQIKFDERRCIAAVQRHGDTYIEVLDFGLCDEVVPPQFRGKRIEIDATGQRIRSEPAEGYVDGMMLDGQH
ncbi:MAG: hypothetical protein Q9162_000146 [Coniocarpon cinnabarinum]